MFHRFFFCLWHLVGVLGFANEVSVRKGSSITLNSGLTEMKDDDLIKWRFGNKNMSLAEINKQTDSMTVYDDVLDGRFRDRLKLDNQTGSLTITNTTTEHTGYYKLQINSVTKYFLLTVYGEKSVSVKIGNSITLNSGFTEIMEDDLIQWKFFDDPILWWYGYEYILIAEIKKWVNSITVHDDVLNGRFRDRLKLDNQTGSLTITNITTEHAGHYKLQSKYMKIDIFFTVYDEISVMEGDSVTLNSHFTEIMDDDEFRRIREKFLDDQIHWRFLKTLIVKFNRRVDKIIVYDDVLDGRFRDRLKLDNQTGSLTITNMRTELAGDYKLKITGAKPSSITFRVSVNYSVHCCGSTEAVIRLVLSALVGVATVILLVYDIRSRRVEQDQE
ncbi:uncharacterized protein LOC127162306 [Labeo rohita]|uniref:uncharacterized protein LOC127162306 n=1 Tax=Labeo rohita TaxID=84645 RepID=UPI0021E2E489|nr:uncharacterized protein LOC127162306 [Labeo rohita]